MESPLRPLTSLALSEELEELACLYTAGLMTPEQKDHFENLMHADRELRAVVTDLDDIANQFGPVFSPVRSAPSNLKQRILGQIDQIPPRVITDREGNVVEINSAFTAMCGYTFSELRGKRPGHFLQGPDSDPEAINELRMAVRDGRDTKVELINYHKNGSPYRVRICLKARFGLCGELRGFEATEQMLERLEVAA